MRLYANQPIGTVSTARNLRRNAPEPERRLLRALRERLPQFKWRHQTPVGPYFVDILCIGSGLAVEVDGDTHAGDEEYDGRRSAYIEGKGFRVIRIANSDLMANLEGAVMQVAIALDGDVA